MSQFNQIYMSKKTIYILLSVLLSVFSFVLVSYSSVFLPLLSTFSINLFNYSIDRNYIFLLFNGILVFLLRNSNFITNSSLVTDHVNKTFTDKFSPVSYHNIKYTRVEKTGGNNLQMPESSRINPEVHTQQAEEEEEERQRKPKEVLFSIADIESEEQKGLVLDTEGDENENCVDEEDEEREELNKRCEEFIRRMKQDIKTEATRQLTTHSVYSSWSTLL